MKQATRHVWYLKKGERISGPFPSKLVLKWRIIGRVQPETLVSLDQNQWHRAEDVAELDPVKQYGDPADPLVKERIAAVIRWEDERSVDRRDGPSYGAAPASGARHGGDRRDGENVRELDARDERTSRRANEARQREDELQRERARTKRQSWLFAITVLVAGAAAFNYLPRLGFDEAPDCAAPAAPGVNWNYCRLDGAALRQAPLANARLSSASLARSDLQSADLSRADLSFANLALARIARAALRDAKLTGANLRGASLSGADLNGADLSYANLSEAVIDGAVFDGAKLDKTIWVDGRVCAFGSIGVCN